MSTLGRWLADILNAHIERDNVPVEVVHPDLAHKEKLVAAYLATLPPVRPCWACGDPDGFHTAHDCDTHFDTTGGAARRPASTPAPPSIRLPVGIDYGIPSASTWRRT